MDLKEIRGSGGKSDILGGQCRGPDWWNVSHSSIVIVTCSQMEWRYGQSGKGLGKRLGWNLFYFLFFIILLFIFCFYAVHNITLPVLPSLSLSPFPFPSFSQPLSLSPPPLSSLPSLPHYYPSYLTALCNLHWFVWLLFTTWPLFRKKTKGRKNCVLFSYPKIKLDTVVFVTVQRTLARCLIPSFLSTTPI